MNYTDVPVKIDSADILATSASVSFSYPIQQSKSLGSQGSPFSSADRPNGSISITYYPEGSDSTVMSLTGLTEVEVSINTIKATCFLSSYELKIAPFKLVEATANFVFFSIPTNIENPTMGDHGGESFANGKDTTVSCGSFSGTFNDVTLSITQEIQPVYLLGNVAPSSYTIERGEISVELVGEDKQSFAGWPCDQVLSSVTISPKDICENTASIEFENLTTTDISFSAQDQQLSQGKIILKSFY